MNCSERLLSRPLWSSWLNGGAQWGPVNCKYRGALASHQTGGTLGHCLMYISSALATSRGEGYGLAVC